MTELSNSSHYLQWQTPDWRCPKSYPDANRADILVFRWEFTRRHHCYRAWYLEQKSGPITPLGSPVQEIEKIRSQSDWRDPNWTVDYKHLNENTNLYADVYESLPYACVRIAKRLSNASIEARETAAVEALRLGFYPAYIRPDEPLEEELDRLRKELSRRSTGVTPRSLRRCKHKFPLYLRMLDAEQAGASVTEIRQQMLTENKNNFASNLDAVRNSLGAAKKWQARFVAGTY